MTIFLCLLSNLLLSGLQQWPSPTLINWFCCTLPVCQPARQSRFFVTLRTKDGFCLFGSVTFLSELLSCNKNNTSKEEEDDEEEGKMSKKEKKRAPAFIQKRAPLAPFKHVFSSSSSSSPSFPIGSDKKVGNFPSNNISFPSRSHLDFSN